MKLILFTMTAALFFSPVVAGEKKSTKAEMAGEIKVPGKKTNDEYNKAFPDISQEELVKLMKEGKVVLIDANGKKKYDKNHIPGAIHYHADDFEKKLPKDKETLLVAYCGGPGCKAWCKAADDAEAMGYKNIRHFSGGIKGWIKAGLDVGKVKKEG